jgi:hypothetical protein
MDPYEEARAIDPDLFDSYGETGRYHLRRPLGNKPSKEDMESASARLIEAQEELIILKEKSLEELSSASRTRGPPEEVYKKYNEYEEVIIPEKEDEIRMIESQYNFYRYEQALQAFKDHVKQYGKRQKKSKRGGMKRRRKTRR